MIAHKAHTEVIDENPNQKDLTKRCPIAKQAPNSEKLENLVRQEVYAVEKGVQHTLKILQKTKDR